MPNDPIPKLKIIHFRPAHKNQVNIDCRQKNKSISISTLEASQLWFPRHKNHVISIQTWNPSHFRPPHITKSASIPILTSSQNRCPTLKSSFFRRRTDPSRWNQVYFDHPHNNQVDFEVNTRTMSLSTRVIFRAIHTDTCSCDTAALRIT